MTTASELHKETGYTRAELMILDMSTFAAVARFSDEFERTHARLDILVCNAGISNLDYERFPDGYESM
jgi:retinol dehydrogenase-12